MKIESILFVDDDDVQSFIAGKVFEFFPEIKEYKIFSNGNTALDYLKERKEVQEYPDLIFVDLKMPEINGFEFIEKYTSQIPPEALQQTGIVILTNSILYTDQQKAGNYKVVRKFFNKPLTKDKIHEIMNL